MYKLPSGFTLSTLIRGVMAPLLVLLAGGGEIAHAANFTVNSTADAVDANPGNGLCASGSGSCTLRAAIIEANALAGPDAITLPAGTYVLAIFGNGEDAAATGDLDITGTLNINGAGASVAVIQQSIPGGIDRVVHVLSGSVTISGVTITGGNAGVSVGGGIYNFGGNLTLNSSTISGNGTTFGSGGGGGIANAGTLTLNNSAVSGNVTSGNLNNDGGGIWNQSGGTAILNSSTVSGNTASRSGGGIYNGGILTMTNTTVSGNAATVGFGGGISNSGTLHLTSSTLSGNSAPPNNGGGMFGAATLANTIVAGSPSGGNCSGVFSSLGHNLSSDATCAFAGPGDLNSTNPLLGPLANNGGATQTHALLAGSPAIDAVPLADCTVNFDQRGVARPQGSACDIGAYEAPGVPTRTPTLTATSTRTATPTRTPTRTPTPPPTFTATRTRTFTPTSSPTRSASKTISPTATETPTPPPCASPPSCMVAWWPLDETTGTVIDDIWLNNLDGTSMNVNVVPAPVFSGGPSSIAGQYVGNSLYFAGELVEANYPLLDFGAGELSIDAWIRVQGGQFPTPTPGGPVSDAIQPIVDRTSQAAGIVKGYALFIHYNSHQAFSQLEFVIGDGVSQFPLLHPAQLVSGWHHVAVTVARPSASQAVATLYVDGQPSTPAALNVGSTTNNAALWIGKSRVHSLFGTGYQEGPVDELEIFDCAITQADIQQIYNAQQSGKCTPTPGTTATPTPTPRTACAGDCDGDGVVTMNEIIILMNIVLGALPPSACSAGDGNHDGVIDINDIIIAQNNAVKGCPCDFIGPRMCGGSCPNPTDVCRPKPDDSGCVCQPSEPTPAPTRTATRTPTPLSRPTPSFTPSRTPTRTPTTTMTPTRTRTTTASPRSTATLTPTRTRTGTATMTRTRTGTPTGTATPTPTSPCGELHSLDVSTGNGPIGGSDPIWWLAGAPAGTGGFPPAHPATVIFTYGGWTTLPNTRWVSANTICGTTTGCPVGLYEYELCWEQCSELIDPMPFMILADNQANVFLDNNFLVHVPGFTTPASFSFNAAPGVHSLRVDVFNDPYFGQNIATPTGMDLRGILTGQLQLVPCRVRPPTLTPTATSGPITATPTRTTTRTRTATPGCPGAACTPTPTSTFARPPTPSHTPTRTPSRTPTNTPRLPPAD